MATEKEDNNTNSIRLDALRKKLTAQRETIAGTQAELELAIRRKGTAALQNVIKAKLARQKGAAAITEEYIKLLGA